MLTWTDCVVFARLSPQRKASAVVLSSLFKSKVSSQSSQNFRRRVRTKWIRQQSLPVYLCLNLGRLLAASEVGGGGCFLLSLQMKGSGSIIETSAFLEKHTGPACVKEGSINRLHIYILYMSWPFHSLLQAMQATEWQQVWNYTVLRSELVLFFYF